jgi:hypothetical protein
MGTMGVGDGVGFAVLVGVDSIVDLGVMDDCFSVGFEFTPHPMRVNKNSNPSNKKPVLK